ncbi:regulatory protein, luxR family [Saccharicrinis carchari]|uniref:Regulatory protein, luxR family n=1 Tax=Saccharicrinis carchari TaxID=1168039 RepID=A0A521CXB2_SACCC|nr:LuxR C-terminal-related transcriptional regulator [Saccharicrinis carchari]SMO64085.1 regulatory protein, luxR family [Saccharicrinis carchari]
MKKINLNYNSIKENGRIRNPFPYQLVNLFNQTKHSTAFIFDLHSNRCIYMAESINYITGHSAEEFIGKGLLFFKSLIHSNDYPQLVCDIVILLNEEKEAINQIANKPIKFIMCKMKHKKELWVQTRVSIISADNTSRNTTEKLIGFIQKYDKILNEGDEPYSKQITNREKQVLQLMASGDSAKIIGRKLNICPNTVVTHRNHLKEKLKAKNTAELIKKGIQFNML